MARIIGDLGSEKALIRELNNFGIDSLHNLNEVEKHIKDSDSDLQAIKEAERNRIHDEIEGLKSKHSELVSDKSAQQTERARQLTNERNYLDDRVKALSVPSSNFFIRIFRMLLFWFANRRLRNLEANFDKEVNKPLVSLNNKIGYLAAQIASAQATIEDELLRRIEPHISKKESIDKAIEQSGKWLVGARGERVVVQSLANLPDSFVVINDVVLHFKPPLRTDNGPRFQCQADHVVVGPNGVFNIETKYWSERSVQNLDLRSPVEQIKITGKGLWRELNGAIRGRQIKLNKHHWGDTNINVRNLLVMVGAMPDADFQMVKLLPIERLRGYIEYFDPVFEVDEVESIVFWITSASHDSLKRSA
ncbi:MAG: NERD domain-containing protein [Bdellovibrionales bacterium]